jgi:mono/diheme cytochrome c family protein
MQTDASNAKTVPVMTGVALGVLVFAGLNLWFGRPFIPTIEDLPTVFRPLPPTAAAMAAAAPSGPTDPGEQVYQTVCAACHQPTGQGLPGSFPPLAGSEWITADPETPIRVVLMGLSGPISVKGAQFTSLMPPPPGLDDDKIAAVLTFVRSHFGNNAGAVTKDQVAAVKQSLAGRTKNFTSEELSSLRKGGEGADKPAAAGPGGAQPASSGAAPGKPADAPPAAKP